MYKPFSYKINQEYTTTRFGTINQNTKSYFIETTHTTLTIPNKIINDALDNFLDYITVKYQNTIKQLEITHICENLNDNGHYEVTIR